ncbi:porin family protein [Saccharicrinis aurantiacus]|uniref:porin family protein n=1 Tax=Saccharicrinis aurantiacus TaxID=1849719 RepID=UPI002490D47A|nr:porin family protein [Saccharicrinis aurantiacus]
MKKIICVVLVIICIGFAKLNAQDFRAGILGGAVFSQIDGDNYAGFNKPGFALGMYAARQINPHWLAQFEILYTQKGAKNDPNTASLGTSTEIYKASLDYIEIPLFARYYLNKFSFDAGVSYGVLVRSKEEDQYGEIDANPFEDHEWATLIGVNYQINSRLYASVRWAYSITRIRKAYEGEYDWQPHPIWGNKFGQYNHNVSVMLHYQFEKLFASN